MKKYGNGTESNRKKQVMKRFISDMETIQLAIKLGDYEDALEMLQEVKEEMIILDALNYDT